MKNKQHIFKISKGYCFDGDTPSIHFIEDAFEKHGNRDKGNWLQINKPFKIKIEVIG